MSCPTHIRHILKRDGTNQFERLMEALRPAFVQVDEKTRDDLLRLVQEFSGQIQFYNLENVRDGDWKGFFEDLNRTTEPHLALIITFLEIYRNAQDHLNRFTLRHLEHYFKKILQISQKPAQPDQVHLLLELAKNTATFKLARGTRFKAGKDQSGKELVYESSSEIVLNKAKVGSLMTVLAGHGPDYRIYSASVANSADGAGKEMEDESSGWSTFGKSQLGLPEQDRTMSDALTGFALASPLLAMKEGKRTVNLSLSFRNTLPDSPLSLQEILAKNHDNAFNIYLSGEKEWLGPFTPAVTKSTDGKKLDLTTTLDAGKDAVVAYDSSTLGGSFETGYPVIKVIINNAAEPYPYEWLRHLRLHTLELKVSVEDMRGLVLQNDQAAIDPSRPFQPFGSTPSTGSKFYIGCSEAFNKELDSLELSYKWKDLPSDLSGFTAYYYLYPGNYGSDGFKAAVSALTEKKWIPASNPEQFSLFETEVVKVQRGAKRTAGKKKAQKKNSGKTGSGEKPIDSSERDYLVYGTVANQFMLSGLYKGNINRSLDVSKLSLKTQTGQEEVTRYDIASKNGFLRLTLTGQDFGHREFSALYTSQAMALGAFMADKDSTGSPPALPNQPYTPVMEYLGLSYSASEVINLESGQNQNTKLFYIEPFGVAVASRGGNGTGAALFPQFKDEGYLYIGLSGLVPRQNLSLMFQVAESSSESDDYITAENLTWSYLSKDKWIKLKKQEIIADSTNGLLNSGIIVLDIPSDATDESCLMPDGYHWLCLSVPQDPAGANRMISIAAQAVTAFFKDGGNDSAHLETVLPAGTISKLVTPEPDIKKITQPYASFGGKPAESDQPFYEPYYTRVSERLRHKNRGITVWDLERIVLEQFPGIYKVKCLNHSSRDTDIAPGNVTMVVIENIRKRNAVNPLQPRTSQSTLAGIEEFMSKYVSPFAGVYVQNPFYEEILVDFKVSFHSGYDAGYYGQLLNEEIKKFLSPWAYAEGCDIMFDNVIYKSSIINFIEEREYVDFLTDFKMYQVTPNWGIGCMEVDKDFVVGDQEKSMDIDQASGRTSRSILVSAEKHDIHVLSAGEYLCGLS